MQTAWSLLKAGLTRPICRPFAEARYLHLCPKRSLPGLLAQEDAADKYAEDKLIPPGEYEAFIKMNEFSENAIRRFAERIDRDPGIVLGRLQNDQIVPFTNVALSKALKHKYKVITS